jgi:hypothetical protein
MITPRKEAPHTTPQTCNLIDWDAPPAASPAAIVAEIADAEPEPVNDAPAVQQFKDAVRRLTSTRDETGIRELLEEALNEVYGVAA